jgi:hypothetical protein
MSKMAAGVEENGLLAYDFESFGVVVRMSSNDEALLSELKSVIRRSLLGNIEDAAGRVPDHVFEMTVEASGDLMLRQDGQDLGASDTKLKAFRFFDSILRVSVGSLAPDLVFLHAGVVEWKGRAIVMPADSFQGKSTLVAELVRRGAGYYSDDFALLDEQARVLPFARQISMRTPDYKTYELPVEDIGGRVGEGPIPVGALLFTRYEPHAVWEPVLETPGTGVLKLIPYTLSIRNRTDFRMKVLHKLASHAIIFSTLRGSAESFAETLLDFVDNNVN